MDTSMVMKCKYCQYQSGSRRALLAHYKTDHLSKDSHPSWPCIINECSFVFQTYGALRCHLSRNHVTSSDTTTESLVLSCERCSSRFSDLNNFLKHLRDHVARHECVQCPFLDGRPTESSCSFSSTVSSTFRSHMSRCHFNATVLHVRSSLIEQTNLHVSLLSDGGDTTAVNRYSNTCSLDPEVDIDESFGVPSHVDSDYEDKVLKFISMAFVRMQCVLNLPVSAIQRVIDDIHDIKALSQPLVKQKLNTSLQAYNISESDLQQLYDDLINDDLLIKSTVRDGVLGTHKKRIIHAKQTLPYVAPKQIELGLIDGKPHKFIYVSIVEMLQELLKRVDVLNAVTQTCTSKTGVYRDYCDGSFCKSNPLFCENECYLKLALYCDEWESTNPLGTNRKKHKVLGFYWSLVNIEPKYRSSLHTIQLAILCNAADVRNQFGYESVLKPLLNDLVLLENDGVYVEKLGSCMKGTLVYVSADNLGAHSIGGYVENFSGSGCICRHCMFRGSDLAISGDDRPHAVRNRCNYSRHVQQVRADESTVKSHGIKRNSALNNDLQFFHVTSGLPPDVFHDLAEGIVPYELAIGIDYFIRRKYFTEQYMRSRLNRLHLKSTDKLSRPVLATTYARSKTIGGNMSKNWTFIRLLPILIGHKVDVADSVWLMLMELKDIFELAVAPVHTNETIALLDMKIYDHKQLFRQCFPQLRMKPKHHYLDHYPSQIRQYGSLIACSTMRYEAKHNYFKQIVHRAKNFKNILLTLSERHQLMQAYFMSSVQYLKSDSEFSGPKETVLHALDPTVRLALEECVGQKLYSPNVSFCLAEKCTVFGTKYCRGLFVASEFVGCLPSFGEIQEICALSGEPHFILRQHIVSYEEQFRCYRLIEVQDKLKCVHVNSLIDYYPLPAYHFQQQWYIIPKHFIAQLE